MFRYIRRIFCWHDYESRVMFGPGRIIHLSVCRKCGRKRREIG